MIKITKFFLIFIYFYSCYSVKNKNIFYNLNKLEIKEEYKSNFPKIILLRSFDVLIVNKEDDEELSWNFKEISKIIKRPDSNENSQFIFDYDPSYENIEIVKANVKKANNNYKEISVTSNDIFETEIQNSNEQFSFSKRRKIINFPNIEKDDLTEVEIKITKKSFNYSNYLDILPLALFPILNLEINIKIENNIKYKISGIFDKELNATNEGKFTNLNFKNKNLEAIENNRYENLSNLLRINTYHENFLVNLAKLIENKKIIINDKLRNFINLPVKNSKDNLSELKSFLLYLNNKMINKDYEANNLAYLYIPTTEEILKENKINWISKLVLLSAFCKIKNIKHSWAFDLGSRFINKSTIKNISPENTKRILLILNINNNEYIFGKIDKNIPFGYNFAEGNLVACIESNKIYFKNLNHNDINKKFINYNINIKEESNEVEVSQELKFYNRFAWEANQSYEPNFIREILENREGIKVTNIKKIDIKKGDKFSFKSSFNTFDLANNYDNLFILKLKEYDYFISNLNLKNEKFLTEADYNVHLNIIYKIEYPNSWNVEFISGNLEEDNNLFYIKRNFTTSKGNLIIEDKLIYKSTKISKKEYNDIVQKYTNILLKNKNIIIFKK